MRRGSSDCVRAARAHCGGRRRRRARPHAPSSRPAPAAIPRGGQAPSSTQRWCVCTGMLLHVLLQLHLLLLYLLPRVVGVLEPEEALHLVRHAAAAGWAQAAADGGGGEQCVNGGGGGKQQHRWPLDGLPAELDPNSVTGVGVRQMSRLWGDMGGLYELRVAHGGVAAAAAFPVLCKYFVVPAGRLSFGDRRKRDSFDVEARFYEDQGLASELRAKAACRVPVPLLVHRGRASGPTILMSKVPGSTGRGELQLAATSAAAVTLARLHAHTWGSTTSMTSHRDRNPELTEIYPFLRTVCLIMSRSR
jgi:hypothetical protein